MSDCPVSYIGSDLPDSVDLLAGQLAGERFGKAVAEIVDIEFYFARHAEMVYGEIEGTSMRQVMVETKEGRYA